MKILFITSYPPEKDGVAVYSKKLIHSLSKIYRDTFVITFTNNLVKNNEDNIYRVLTADPLQIVKTYMLIKKIKPDIIHVQFAIPTFRFLSVPLWLMLALYKSRSTVKIVVTLHEVKREYEATRVFGKYFFGTICGITDKIFVHTLEARNILVSKCNVNYTKLKVIPLGTYQFLHKQDYFNDLKTKYNLFKKNIILYFGYVHIDKGIQYLLEAADKLYSQNPKLRKNTVFVIAGDVRPREGVFKVFEKRDHNYLSQLNNIAKSLGLNNFVRFTGYIDEKRVYSLIRLSKIVVLPYTKVEQSGVLNMAIAVHKPTIASNIGGFKEILKESGVLVPPYNPKRISDSILKLIENKQYYSEIVNKYKDIERKQNSNQITKDLIKEYKLLTQQKLK